MELPLQDDFDTSTSQIKPVSDITTIATDLFLNPVAQAADTDNNAPTSEEPSTASAADTQTPPTDIVAVAPVISLPVDTTSGADQSATPPVDETQQLPPDIAVDPISLPVDTTSGVDQSATPPVDETQQLPPDIAIDPISLPVDTTSGADQSATPPVDETQQLPPDIAIDPISLPVDTTSGADQSATPPVDETQQLPPHIAVDPISLPVDTTSGTDQSTTPPVDIAVDQPIEPIYTFPTDFGGFIECGSFISAGFIDYGWMTVVSAPTPTFADITFAEATITLPPLEPIVLDSSLNLDVSDNVVTDAPAVSLIGVPDISVQAF